MKLRCAGVLAISLSFLLFCGIAFAQTTTFSSPGALNKAEQRRRREISTMHGRAVPRESAAALRYRAHIQKMQMRAEDDVAARDGMAASSAPSITGSWVPLGPAPLASDASGMGLQDYNWVSGRATAIAIDPADPSGNTVYVGGAYGGVWKSTNGLALPENVKWVPIIDDQPTLSVGSIAIQPGNAPGQSVILVGTGETNDSSDSYYGLGILRWTDASSQWNLITQDTGKRSFAGLGFSRMAFSSSSPNLVVAGASSTTQGLYEGLENPVSVNRGVYYSTDSGASWTYATMSDGSTATDPSLISSVAYNASAGQFFAASSLHGFYSSSDGIHWTRLTNQPGSGLTASACPAHVASPSACPVYRGELTVVPGRNEMYAWYVDANENDQGIWKTLNGGNTWIQINESGITNCGDLFGGCGTADGTYNLELAALPNGSATDIYAGAVNLYKCTITNNFPSCNGTGRNGFLNLTHVYGCSSIAKVHPAQHDLAYAVVNGTSLMYFANDGGVYRTLDGYTGLTTDICGASNQFDSLNQTLGSMTQLVSFSQASGDPALILAGTEDDGAPATDSAEGSAAWLNANAGTVGYTAVNPSNENEWFISTPPDSGSGVNIFGCELGTMCLTQDFANNQIVSQATIGGDTGGFYLPFMLDSQNSDELILGTCRVWRGSSTGSAFTALSNNFETGGSAICTGNETNMVRSLAGGGFDQNNHDSSVIYAGTDGLGPVDITSPTGGHVWVSTDVAGGTTTWVDKTGTINPDNFPVSSIAVDTSDVAGLTAYVGIMGFHVAHIWQTTNGGASWADFTSLAPNNLPDVPVNAVLVDPGSLPSNGTIYVGTDVGVFASSTGSPSWVEVGPVPGGGSSGYLPNAPVTALRIFNSGGYKYLRASTYGRGMWEFNLVTTPNFQITVSNNPLTVFAGQTAVFNGLLVATNGFNSFVNLSCASGATQAPPSCLVSSSSVLPTPSGATVTVSASGPAANYVFNLQGVDVDDSALVNDRTLTLHIVDFNLTTLSSNSVSLSPAQTSSPITFQVTAAGVFNGIVNLSCTGLLAGASCDFVPASVSPVAGTPVNVSLTITTGPSTPAGSFPITINGSSIGGPTKTQNLTLHVTGISSPDYALAISNSALTAAVNTTASFNGALTSLNGYGSTVNLSCGVNAPPTCQINPSSMIPSVGGTSFTVTVSSNAAQSYAFNIVAVGTDPVQITHSMPVNFTSGSGSGGDFSIGASRPQTVKSGSSAQYAITFSPLGASTFAKSVSYTCDASSSVPLGGC